MSYFVDDRAATDVCILPRIFSFCIQQRSGMSCECIQALWMLTNLPGIQCRHTRYFPYDR
jgi:hypothetical protein